VQSTRGAAGGYQLIKAPEEITLGEVMAVIDGQQELPNPNTSRSASKRALLRAWRDVLMAEQQMLNELTFADLCRRATGEVESMYHI
jgi:DNA-binding IscR family transcriptional regulator